MVTAERVAKLLEDRPDLVPSVEAVLDADPPFAFDDVDVDSGAFGELVSRDIVEKTDGGFRVADRDVVVKGLSGDLPKDSEIDRYDFGVHSLPVNRLAVSFLAGALLLVAAFRLSSLPNVYHAGHVVLSGNDPYAYRYLVEQLLTDPDVTPANLEFGVSRGEPLFVTTIWFVTKLLGGTQATVGHVLAWYPVVSALVTGLLLYALAVVVTGDRRIGLASVAMLAVIPAHAFRTSLGFADHHAFDYPWLVLTLLGVALVVREARREGTTFSGRTIAAVATIAFGVTGQTLAWDNSPLLIVPVGGYLAVEALRAVYADRSPVWTAGPVVAGVAVGAALVWLAHDTLGWHTTLVASAPLLLTIGGVGVLAAGEIVHRTDLPTWVLAVVEAVGLVAGTLALRAIRPEFWTRLDTGVRQRLLAPREIAEVGGLFGDSLTWLILLGFALFVALPYLAWATYRAVEDSRWLPPVTYAWYFLALSLVQVRFVGELAPVLTLFAGFGLVHLAERVDVAQPPAPFAEGLAPHLSLPTPHQFGVVAVLFLLLGSFGMVMAPITTSQVAIPQERSDAALWMADFSEEHGMEYPRNYVFSEWSWSRMYNYFVNGQSGSYGYAQSNFQSFVSSRDGGGWYDRLGKRRGFVVTSPAAVGLPNQIGTRLQRHHGSWSRAAPGLAHYRLVHVSGEYKVFTVVPGAVIEGTAAPNATVAATTIVDLESTSFDYVRKAETGPDGNFSLHVAQPGTYQVGNLTARVSVSDVRNGSTVAAS